jgi:multicomponent Na+:H+ antiporter subunit C
VIATHYVYWVLFAIMMIGLYVVISHGNLLKKMIGLSVFQVGVFLFYISLGKVRGGSAPIISSSVQTYSHPLPQVLILTAIVVGVATLAVGLGLATRIFETYGTVEEDEVIKRSATDPADGLPEDILEDDSHDADDEGYDDGDPAEAGRADPARGDGA